MKSLVGVATVVVLGLVAAPSVSAGAAPVAQESYRISGSIAEAGWNDPEAQVNEPWAIAVVGADAVVVSHVRGTKPARQPQVSVFAAAMLRPGANPGDEPVPVELWAISEHPVFTVADDLSSASLHFEAVGEFVDPMNDDTPTGETLSLSVTVTWNATGPLERHRTHDRYAVGKTWSMDIGRSLLRSAAADITVTTPDGIFFDGPAQEGTIQDVKAATLMHG